MPRCARLILVACGLICGVETAAPAQTPVWRPYIEMGGGGTSLRTTGQTNLFVPIVQDGESMLFADLRGLWTDLGEREGNWGLAYRQILDSDRIFGVYAFYDQRHSELGNSFQQGTLGAELLSVNRGFRTNIYLPDHSAKLVPGLTGAFLQGGTIVVRRGEERAYYGGDVEVESLLWRRDGGACDCWSPRNLFRVDAELWASIGLFHFGNSGSGFDSFSGGRLRTELRLFDLPALGDGSRLVLSGQYEYDDVRDHVASGILTARIPFGRGSGGGRLRGLARRMVAPIIRDIDIITNVGLGDPEPAKALFNGQTIQSALVVDANTDLSTAIANAGPNSVVIVDGGAGAITEANTSQLSNGQIVLGGAGTLEVIGCNTGTHALFAASGVKPTINFTDPTMDVFVLADNSAVINTTINGGNDGVSGVNVTNFLIQDNMIRNVQDDGISLLFNANRVFTGEIRGNMISNTDLAMTTTGEGVEIVANGNAVVDLSQSIVGNLFTNVGSDAILVDANDQSSVTVRIQGNTVNGAEDDGFEFETSENASLIANLSDNVIIEASDDAIEFNAAGASTVNTTIASNQILGGAAVTNDGIDLDLDGTAQITAHIEDNWIINVSDIAIEADVNDMATLDLSKSIVGNFIMGAGDDAINIELDGADLTASAIVNIRNNIITDINDDGVFIDVNDAGTVTATIQNNQFLRAGADGIGDAIEISVSDHDVGDISLTTTITGNQFNSNATAVRLSSNDNDSNGEYLVNVTTNITGNTFLNNGVGVAMQYDSDSDADDGQFVANTMITSNTFTNTTVDAIELDVGDWDDEDLTIALGITSNQFMTTGGDAIDLNVSDINLDTGVVNFLPTITSNTFTDTTGDVILINVADDASLIGDIRSNTATGGTNGLNITSGGTGPNNVIIGGNSLNTLTGTGILFDSANATNILDLGLNNTVMGAATIFTFNNQGNLSGSQILINGVRRP